MPNFEEHCQHSFKRYGVRGEDIHRYIDEPCRSFGPAHRKFRHDTETIKLVGNLFGEKYGKVMAQNIALDHITADHEEEIRKGKFILLKCPNCGGKLNESSNGQCICKYCGYETKVLDIEANSLMKLPKRGWLVRLRKNNDDTLPIALPPIELHYGTCVVDEIYSEFQDREDVSFVLDMLGYKSIDYKDFKSDRNGALTDNEIRKIVFESKKITIEQIKAVLSKGDLFLKRCSKCDRHVYDYGKYGFSGGFHLHQTIIKKGVVYCVGCGKKMNLVKVDLPMWPCFIVTATYGTRSAREINVLRTFRDKKLNSTHCGRSIVAFYYNISPIIAKVISRSENMRALIRYLLNPIIINLKKTMSISSTPGVLLV